MGDVTAVSMDVITEKSGHNMTPCAVSVCITPAAPSPLPMPYPVTASIGEGSTDAAMRTKINGANVVTVGSVFKACHGNEAGTLKEVVSLNTGGPCFLIMGAPIVLIELGMAGITGSPGMMNKAITVGAGGNASGAGGGGGGSGSGSSRNAPTAKDRALAAAPGNTPEQIAARKKVASHFYQEHGQKFDRKSGKVVPTTRNDRIDQLKCIDYNKPVVTGPPPPCQSPLGQWQAAGGNRGGFFAPPGTKPEALGIGSQGTSWNKPGQPVGQKVETQHTIAGDQPYMQSTASPANDTWSVPGTTQPAPGGGTQVYVPGGCDPANGGISP